MEAQTTTTTDGASTPAAALFWGWAGVVPFAALALIIAFASGPLAQVAWEIIVPYGAIILTFMGGIHWGVIIQRPAEGTWLYTSGILPSLFAVSAIVLPHKLGLLVLALGLAVLLAIDLRLAGWQMLPQWYGRLRLQLTVSVLLCLALAGLLG